MPETEKWNAILTLGATVAEETLTRVKKFPNPISDDVYVLSSALAWAILRRLRDEGDDSVLNRWRYDVPDALNRYLDGLDLETWHH